MQWADMASLVVLTLSKRAKPAEGNVIHGILPFKMCGLTELNYSNLGDEVSFLARGAVYHLLVRSGCRVAVLPPYVVM